ncbi:MAG: hypothetical protein IJA72_04905 [Clostridia bacterium]|nr:hypothetical protein [Clostridia bacterium]
MNKEKQLLHLYNYINDCWKLAMEYDAWEIKDELNLPTCILTSWEQEGWVDACSKIDNIAKNINRLAKEKPEYLDGCKMLRFKVDMINKGVEITLEKEFGLKVYSRNGELII